MFIAHTRIVDPAAGDQTEPFVPSIITRLILTCATTILLLKAVATYAAGSAAMDSFELIATF